ncbi:MAG: 30S ribosomal protein S12 methylthiotransferase RimO [Lachnospiraceae bacterium]|nr:30S ribosomal protein S12 methylthiotransferase RimO [Lachnospiraceae bacterium]
MFNIYMASLGCDKNTADSEKMLSILSHRGYMLVNAPEEADAAVVNTCCFIQSATEESIQQLLDLAEYKKDRLQYLIAVGCMAERFKDDMKKNLPEVDALIGTAGLDQIADVLDDLRGGKKDVDVFEDINKKFEDQGPVERVITEHPYMEYLKIAEGCDKRCTYCAIPYFKGKYRSVPMERILLEARGLVRNGVKELILVAQETTCYGVDLYGEKRLPQLLQALGRIEGLEWIRLLYCYPEAIDDELIAEMASNPKVLHYVDMPIQHTEDSVLKRMGRRIDHKGIIDVVAKMRAVMPDIAIRSTIVTGFPGETQEDHANLMETLASLKLDHVGAFTYSREEGTPAFDFPDQVEEEMKESYRDDIMELQAEISNEHNENLVGKELDVLIEGYLPDDGVYMGRTYRDAPEVDSFVWVKADRELMSGSIVPVQITDHNEYDLFADLVEEDY